MKKYLRTFLVIFTLSITVHLLSAAMWIPGSGSGDNSGPGVWKNSNAYRVQLTYDQLANLCTSANIALQGNHYTVVQADHHDGMYCALYKINNYYVIRLYEYNTTATDLYLCVDQDTVTGGRYWAYAPYADENTGKPFYDKLEAIRSQLVNVNNTLTSISNKLTDYLSGFPTYASTVTSWFSARGTDIQNIANRLVVTRSDGTYALTTIVNWIYDSLYVDRSDTGHTRFTSILNWIYNDLSGDLTTRITAIQSSVSNTAARLVYTAPDGDYSLSNIAYQQWKDGRIWVSTNTYAAPESNMISPDVANQMIAYINAECPGKYAYFWRSLNTYSSKPTIVSARISSTNKLIVVSCLNSQGSVVEYTLRSANGNNYKVDESLSPGVDTASIVAAINRIYNWLDNADLATNATIVNVVQQNVDSAQDGVDIASEILKLFKTVFDFDRPGPDFPSVVQYFYNLGRDPE